MSENKLNIETNSGNILNQTSYNVRQEINANVIGVLKYNNEIRKKLLSRNIGKYNVINLNEGIGYIPNFYSNELSKPFSLGEDGLLGYTHIYSSDYQKNINTRYNIGDYIQYYQHGSLSDNDNLKWNGNYKNYIEFINDVLGLPIGAVQLYNDLFKEDKLKNSNYSSEESQTIRTIINDFIQYDNIKYAMETTRIGSINPNPLAALSGAVTTNISSFSGTDTKLGLLTNQIYAHTLRRGAQFNTIRETQYITPEIYNTIGNKLSTISILDSNYRFDDETGRIIDFSSVKTTDVIGNGGLFKEVIENINSLDIGSKSKNYLIDNLNRNTYSFEHPEIIEDVGIDDSWDKKTKRKYLRNYKKYKKKGILETQYKETGNSIVDYVLKNYLDFDNTLKKVDSTWDESDEENEFIGDAPKDSIIYKTKELFNNKKINNLVSRFFDDKNKENNILQSAVNNIYGISHGRNLLTSKEIEKKDNYENPYCRVWTKNHQYDNISKLISNKPINENKDLIENFGRRKKSVGRLEDNSVRNSNGFINITPSNDASIDIKKCMFSIENLAWKDVASDFNLSKEQQGPNGGRIMWFPPYNLSFNENISTNWNSNDFIGRGEKIYTYINTERTGTLSFDLLVDYPSILDMWKKNGENLTRDIQKDEETLLRFFAGDENLKLRNLEKEINDLEDAIDNVKSDISNIKRNGYIQEKEFTLYFPRYYSGVDEDNIYEAINNILSYETPNAKVNYPYDKNYYDYVLVEYNQSLNDSFNADFFDFMEIFRSNNDYEIKKIEIIGRECPEYEKYVGNENLVLSKNRCETIKFWLEEKYNFNTEKFDIKSEISEKINTCFSFQQELYKTNRSVTIKIKYTNIEDDFDELYGLNETFKILNKIKLHKEGYKIKETVTRWDQEAQYFEMLKNKDSFTYDKIIEKVKYFTPAFHSITPEGFNARLSFLHQCTRQGQTLNSSDNKDLKSAGNLSFGRPPICVLRIGDFFNTKIVINSITINYDNNGVQWDLNQEGIGIQPMMAKISLNFAFLGGSDLTGPISRLQNAVSFNYYANQSIYDDRADIAQIENKQSKIHGEPWTAYSENYYNKK